MWNSDSQCNICYKIWDENEFSEQDHSEEDRRKLLNLCREYLFSELCDWNSISCTKALPFCVECFGVVGQIQILNEKCKVQKSHISDFADQFAVKVLRLRNRRDVEEFPKVIGGVRIKLEKGVEEEKKCNICHKTYNEKPRSENESLNLTIVAKVIRICKKYLFSEIFDDGSLELHLISRNNILPFCFECCINIQDLCQKSDLIDTTVNEIESVVDIFTLKILNYRRNGNVTGKSDETLANVSLSSTPDDNSFWDSETASTAAIEESDDIEVLNDIEDESDDDDCMIVAVVPAGVQKNFLNSLCNKLRVNKAGTTVGEENTQMLKPAFPDRKILLEKRIPSDKGPPSPVDQLPFELIGEKMKLSKRIIEIDAIIKESKSNDLSEGDGNKDQEKQEPNCSADIPGSSTNLQSLRDRYTCQKCRVVFTQKQNYEIHMESCLKDVNSSLSLGELTADESIQKPVKPFQCPSCNRSFLRRNHLNNHLRAISCWRENFSQKSSVPRKRRRPTSKKHPKGKLTKGPFKCDMCPFKCTHIGNLGRQAAHAHLSSHFDIADPRRRCDICRTVFSTTNQRNLHVDKFHLDKIKRCYYVDRVDIPPALESAANGQGQGSSVLEEHSPRGKLNKMSFSCNMCPFKFSSTTRYDIHAHLSSHFDIANPRRRCDICRIVFSKLKYRNYHFRKFHPDRITTIYRTPNLYHHVDRAHIPLPLESAENDQEQGVSEEHSPATTPAETGTSVERTPRYCCSICKTRFYWLPDLRTHLQEHLHEAP